RCRHDCLVRQSQEVQAAMSGLTYPAAPARAGDTFASADRSAQLNQQRLVTDRSVQASFAQLLAFVARQIRDLEQSIAALLDQDPAWRELNQAFRTIKGVADRTVARLMAEMPEIGTLSNKT